MMSLLKDELACMVTMLFTKNIIDAKYIIPIIDYWIKLYIIDKKVCVYIISFKSIYFL